MKYCAISIVVIAVVLSTSAPGHTESMPAPEGRSGTAVIPATRPTCAILTLDAKGGLSAEECGLLTDRFMVEFDRIGQYRLLPRSKMSEVLKMQEFSRTENCSASECAVEAGKLLSVQYMVYGSIGKIGNTYTLNTFMVNVESGEAEKRATTDHEGRIDDLLKLAMALNARQLLGLSTETETRPVVRVAAQPPPNSVEEAQTESVKMPQPQPRSLKKELLLWNRLESENDIKRSSVGPGGKMNGGRFVPGRFGNGIELNMNEQYGVTFPADTVAGPDGCIEFWAKLVDFPNDLAWGARPALLSGDDGQGAHHFLMLHLNGNDGQSNGGLIADIPGLANGATGQYGQWTYARALGADSADDWHHYAMVWASAGIQDVNNGKRTVAAYVDGKLNSSIWRGIGGNIRPVVPATGRFGLLWHSGMQGGRVVFDNLKVWNYAKTDFNDRVDEMKAEPDRETTLTSFPANLTKGLALYYSFDKDEGGKVTDRSGGGHDARVFGAKWTRSAQVGGGYVFNGENDYIDLGTFQELDFNASTSWTYAFWMSPRGSLGNMAFFGRWGNNNNYDGGENYLYYQKGRASPDVDGISWGAVNGEWDSGVILEPDQWQHVVVMYNASIKRASIYVNGVEKSSLSVTSVGSSSGPMRIGYNANISCFKGVIDEVMIFDRALSNAEVKQLWNLQTVGTVNGKVDGEDSGLILLNKMGSDKEVRNSAVGPSGTIKGTIDEYATGVSGNAAHLRGSAGEVYFDVPYLENARLGTDPFTIAFWAKSSFVNQTEAFVMDNTSKSTMMIRFIQHTSSTILAAIPTTCPDNIQHEADTNYHHYAIVFHQNGRSTFYVDSVAKASCDNAASIGQAFSSRIVLSGAWNLVGGYDWNGYIDEVRMYNKALTVEEVKLVFDLQTEGIRQAVDLKRGLILHYSFDKDEDGKVTDISGKGHNGEVRGAKWTTNGKAGGAYDFNGNGDYIDTGYNLSGMDEISVCGWVRPARAARGASVVTQFGGPASDNVWGLFAQIDSGDDLVPPHKSVAGVLTADGRRPMALGKPTQIGQWTHLCFTFKRNGQIVLYKDGVAVGRDTVSNSPLNKRNSTAKVGASLGGDGYFANGLVDEVMIYNRELTEEEVKQIYYSQK